MAVELMDITATTTSKKDMACPPQTTVTHPQNLEQSPTDCSMTPRNATPMTTTKTVTARLRTGPLLRISCLARTQREEQQEQLCVAYSLHEGILNPGMGSTTTTYRHVTRTCTGVPESPACLPEAQLPKAITWTLLSRTASYSTTQT